MSRDPAGYKDELNLHLYAASNPVVLLDPLGLEACNKRGACEIKIRDWKLQGIRLQIDKVLEPTDPYDINLGKFDEVGILQDTGAEISEALLKKFLKYLAGSTFLKQWSVAKIGIDTAKKIAVSAASIKAAVNVDYEQRTCEPVYEWCWFGWEDTGRSEWSSWKSRDAELAVVLAEKEFEQDNVFVQDPLMPSYVRDVLRESANSLNNLESRIGKQLCKTTGCELVS